MSDVLEVSPRDYHTKLKVNRADIFAEDSFLSKSVLWELDSSSLYRWRFSPRKVNTSPAIEWGTLIDCLITTPHEFGDITAHHSFESFRTKEAKEFKKSAKESGKILIDDDYLREVNLAADRIRNNREALKIIEESKTQVILTGNLKGVKFKGLVDLAPENKPYLADIKTTGQLSLEDISKRVASLGYHVQAAIYLKLWNQMFPDDQRNRFRHIWQSQSAPYEVAVTELASVDINCGDEYAAFLLNRLIQAAKRDKWPNICDDKVAMISRPQYAMYQEEEKMEGVFTAPKTGEEESA